jgi:glucose/arabinose dehydrogenase
LAELNGVGYYIYVDDQKQTYAGVACRAGTNAGSFICQAPLPKMNPGTRTLQLSSFYLTTPDAESPKSGALQIIVQGVVAGGAAAINKPDLPSSMPSAAAASKADAWPAGLVKIADGLERPSDLAITSDSRAWIAERTGRVRVVRGGALVQNPALTLDRRREEALVSLTPDPHFDTNHFIFAIYTERSRAGPSFVIARFREASDTLADRVIILDNIPASSDARANLRFGLDGKLYAAFDDGGSASLAEDPASFNGKLLRLNSDGTTPDDAPGKSPIMSAGPSSPRGLAWHRATARLWAADTFTVGGVRWPSSLEAVAVLNDDLLVASEAGLTRAQIQRSGTPGLGGVRDVVRNMLIRALATGPDGTIYVATDTAIGRLQ